MKLLATHITRYWYSGPVSMCHTEVHLHPRARKNQTILEFGLDVSPDARFRALARRLLRQRGYFLFHRRAAPRVDHYIALPGQSGALRATDSRTLNRLGAGARGSGKTRHARNV